MSRRRRDRTARVRFALLFVGVAVATSAGWTVSAADAPAPVFDKVGRAFIEKHCLACHSGKAPKAELSLEPFRDSASVVKQRKVWDNALKMIATGEMLPNARPRPTVAEAEAFTDLVKAVFDHADTHAKPDPGRVTMRRLNRVEYRNTIRDLVGVNFDPTEDFPSDDIGHGFDNIGDALTVLTDMRGLTSGRQIPHGSSRGEAVSLSWDQLPACQLPVRNRQAGS